MSGGPTKAVESMTEIELLRDLADSMRWPRWFDTDEGGRYAAAVRPRLLELAARLGPAIDGECGVVLGVVCGLPPGHAGPHGVFGCGHVVSTDGCPTCAPRPIE
jgi:hypothetical protein